MMSLYFARALDTALASTAINPQDSWAIHAAAHVYEMRGEFNQGIEYLDSTLTNWNHTTFKPHLWWHYCLFLLQTDRPNKFEVRTGGFFF